MADTLMGGERSGTPVETRGASADLAKLFQQMIQSGGLTGGGPDAGRMSSESWMNMLGFDPTALGLSDAIVQGLKPPGAALGAALEPFEARETSRQVGGLRDMFGTMGGRFSRNLGSAEGELRSGLAQGFDRVRAESELEGMGMRNNFIAQLLGLNQQQQQNSNQRLGIASQFLQPGAPVITEGLLPGLIGAGGNLAALYLTQGLWSPRGGVAGTGAGAVGRT